MMMESTISTILGLWRSKVGKWPVLMVLIFWATYFITLYFTGNDKEMAAGVAAVVPFLLFIFAVFAFFTFDLAFAAVVATVVAFVATVVAFAFVDTAFVFVFLALALVFAAFRAVVVVANQAKKYDGISKKAVWISYAAEFIVILISMLITVLG